MCLTNLGMISIHVEWLQISDASQKQMSQYEIVVKTLGHFNTQCTCKVKYSNCFKPLLAIKAQTTW